MNKNKVNNYNFIEVCAGCGGLSSGLIKTGMIPILLNEINNDCCNTLKLNHPNINIEKCSMLDLDLTPYKNKVDLLTGGVPCQSFSQAGMRKGLDDDRGDLMIKFIEIIKEIHPDELPEIISVSINGGLPAYLQWLSDKQRHQTKTKYTGLLCI